MAVWWRWAGWGGRQWVLAHGLQALVRQSHIRQDPATTHPPTPQHLAGLQLDPSNEQMKQGLEDAKAAQAAGERGGGSGMGGLFASPEVLSRLATNPQVRSLGHGVGGCSKQQELCGAVLHLLRGRGDDATCCEAVALS